MKHYKLCLRLVCVAALFLSLTNSGLGRKQIDDDKITVEETREVNELAHHFVKRMQETKDVAPLLEEMFAAQIFEHDLPLEPPSHFEVTFAKQLGKDEWKRWFGLQKGTKLIHIGVPIFALIFGRINGQLKIVEIYPFTYDI